MAPLPRILRRPGDPEAWILWLLWNDMNDPVANNPNRKGNLHEYSKFGR
jgi:hypothetical protein